MYPWWSYFLPGLLPDGLLNLGGYAFATLALCKRQRFLVAAMIAFLPAAESWRLGFGASGVAFDDSPFSLAHLFRCAAAIRARPAALILRRLRFGASDGAVDSPV